MRLEHLLSGAWRGNVIRGVLAFALRYEDRRRKEAGRGPAKLTVL